MPKVSVIITTYNCKKYLENGLASVLNQTFQDFEIIVVDDASSDGTDQYMTEICQHESKIKYIRLEKNFGGPSRPRNLGVAQAKGKYLTFLDADDLWAPSKLEVQVDYCEKSNASFICTDKIIFSEEDPVVVDPPLKEYNVTNLGLSTLLRKNWIPLSSIMLLKSAIPPSVEFDEDKKLIAVEDYKYWLDLLAEKGGEIHKIHIPLIYYRKSPFSISGNKFSMVKKVFYLFDVLKINGSPLGTLHKYFYMMTYLFHSFWAKMVGKI